MSIGGALIRSQGAAADMGGFLGRRAAPNSRAGTVAMSVLQFVAIFQAVARQAIAKLSEPSATTQYDRPRGRELARRSTSADTKTIGFSCSD